MSKACTAGLVLSATQSSPKGALIASCNLHLQVMTFQAFLMMGFGFLITTELDQSSADPIQLCAHIVDHSISLLCHVCVDRSGSRSIPRLRNAKNADASKDNRRPSRHRSADSSSGELSAKPESSTQYPCTQEYDEQDVERPNRQQRLRRVHP